MSVSQLSRHLGEIHWFSYDVTVILWTNLPGGGIWTSFKLQIIRTTVYSGSRKF